MALPPLLLDDAKEYLSTVTGLPSFISLNGFDEETPDDAVALDEAPGLPPRLVFGSASPSTERPQLQALCRSKSKRQARVYAELVYQNLSGMSGEITSTGTRYLLVTPGFSPVTASFDDSAGRWIISVRLDVEKTVSALS